MILTNIPLKRIDTSDTRYRISLERPPEQLQQSIASVGLIYPPILTGGTNGKSFVVVTGFQRLACVQSLNWEFVPALILPELESEPLKCLMLGFHGLASRRDLKLCEKAGLVARLRRVAGLSPSVILEGFFSLLRLSANEIVFDRLMKINHWSESVKMSASMSDLNQIVLLELADCCPNDAECVIQYLCDHRWGSSRQREICSYLIELARICDQPISEIVADSLANPDINDLQISLPQRAERLRLWLRRKRYPHGSEIEESFRQLKRSLHIPSYIILNEPPDFEGEHYRVQFKFKSRREFEQITDDLQGFSRNSQFDELFRFL